MQDPCANPVSDLRIISFLPAATEMVYALGLGDQLIGVSHECDFPAAARSKPVVVRPALAFAEMSLREIDVAVSERMRNGQSIYQVDENLLRELRPNLILTQNLCQICAPSGNELTVALKLLRPKPDGPRKTAASRADLTEALGESELRPSWESLPRSPSFPAMRNSGPACTSCWPRSWICRESRYDHRHIGSNCTECPIL